MQRTRILLSIGDKNMENYFLLFMDNKIAQGRPSIIIDGWKEILPTAGAKMNVSAFQDIDFLLHTYAI